MSAGKIVLLVFGVIVLLLSLALLAAGGTTMWVDKVHIDEEGFIAVYPQALGEPLTWFGVLFGEQGHPDMNFFRDLVVYLQTEISVDPAMIYVTGVSNGGSMAIAGKAGKKRSQAGRFD